MNLKIFVTFANVVLTGVVIRPAVPLGEVKGTLYTKWERVKGLMCYMRSYVEDTAIEWKQKESATNVQKFYV